MRNAKTWTMLAVLALSGGTALAGVPVIDSISPGHAAQGGASFTLTLNGSNFDGTSVVNWFGQADLAFDTQTPIQLTATVPVGYIAAAGSFDITVTTGAGTSNIKSFTVVPPLVVTVNVTVNCAVSVAFSGGGLARTWTLPNVDPGSFSDSGVNGTLSGSLDITNSSSTGVNVFARASSATWVVVQETGAAPGPYSAATRNHVSVTANSGADTPLEVVGTSPGAFTLELSGTPQSFFTLINEGQTSSGVALRLHAPTKMTVATATVTVTLTADCN